MKPLLLASILLSFPALAENTKQPCRADDYYCQSKQTPMESESKITKAKKLSDQIVPVKVEEPAQVEAINETNGQGILRTY